MALITEGPGVWYESFIDGQGVGITNYFAYPEDLDTNFETARNAINLLDERIGAVGGPNALIAVRGIALNDADGPQSWPPENLDVETPNGFIGAHSYVITINADDTKADIAAGQMIMGGGFVEQSAGVTLSGVGVSVGAQDHYFSVDLNGYVSVSDTQGARTFGHLAWDGSKYTGTWARYYPVFWDGDAWRQLQERPANLAFPAKLHEMPHVRLNALERLLSGYDTDSDGAAIGPLALPFGLVADPQVCLGAAGVADAAGWYRPASNQWGFSDGTNLIFFAFNEGFRFVRLGDVTDPVIQLGNLGNAGFYYESGVGPAVTHGGVKCIGWDGGRTRFPLGTGPLPGLTPIGDPNSGHYSPGADRLGGSTAGNQCYEFDATGNLDLPLNSRCRTLAAAQSITGSGTGTTSNIAFAAEDYDVGGWHDNATNNDRHTCPTGADGTYHIRGTVRFLESSAGGGGTANTVDYRLAQITVNGSAVDHAAQLIPPTGATAALDTILTVDETVVLAAADIVRLACDHDNGGTMNIEAEFSIEKAA